MNDVKALLLGLLGSSAIPAVVGALTSPVTGGIINTDLASVVGLTIAFFPFALAASVMLGGPLFLFFLHFGWVRWWSGLLSGGIAGGIVAMLLTFPKVQIKLVSIFTLEGAASGLAFWAIWRLGHDAQQDTEADSGTAA